LRIRAGSAKTFLVRLQELDLPSSLAEEIAPAVAMMTPLNDQIRGADKAIARITQGDDGVSRLCTVPGVGLVTAAAFVATIDQASRFAGAHQVEAYLGLVPREMSSGERQHKGRITKSGNGRDRSLLVEAAWSILRYDKPETAALRIWAERIAARRGKSRAVVALARRLAGILFALMRDGTVYQSEVLQRSGPRTEAA